MADSSIELTNDVQKEIIHVPPCFQRKYFSMFSYSAAFIALVFPLLQLFCHCSLPLRIVQEEVIEVEGKLTFPSVQEFCFLEALQNSWDVSRFVELGYNDSASNFSSLPRDLVFEIMRHINEFAPVFKLSCNIDISWPDVNTIANLLQIYPQIVSLQINLNIPDFKMHQELANAIASSKWLKCISCPGISFIPSEKVMYPKTLKEITANREWNYSIMFNLHPKMPS